MTVARARMGVDLRDGALGARANWPRATSPRRSRSSGRRRPSKNSCRTNSVRRSSTSRRTRLLGEALLAANQPADARAAFEKALARTPGRTDRARRADASRGKIRRHAESGGSQGAAAHDLAPRRSAADRFAMSRLRRVRCRRRPRVAGTLCLPACGVFAKPGGPSIDRKALAGEVRAEFLHAWNGYNRARGDTTISIPSATRRATGTTTRRST